MSCNANASNIGPALSAMIACPSMPLARDPVLVERISSDRARPGATVAVDFGAIPATDAAGRFAHIRSLKIAGQAVITVPGATNPAIGNHAIRGIVDQIFLSDETGHEFLSGLNARSLVDDAWLRTGYRLHRPLDSGLSLNVGAGTHNVPLIVEIPLVGQGPGASPTEGIISLATLQKRGQQAMRFRLQPTIPAYEAEVTVTSFVAGDGTAGLDVWADVVYLPALAADAPWCLREYTKTERSGTFEAPEAKHEYLVVRYWPEDGDTRTGEDQVADIDGVTVQLAGANILAGATQADWATRDNWLQMDEPQSFLGTGNALLMLPQLVAGRAIGFLVPPRTRENAPAGSISFKYSTQPNPMVRYLHRYTLCESSARATKIKRTVMGDCAAEVVQNINGALVAGVVDSTAPKLIVKKS